MLQTERTLLASFRRALVLLLVLAPAAACAGRIASEGENGGPPPNGPGGGASSSSGGGGGSSSGGGWVSPAPESGTPYDAATPWDVGPLPDTGLPPPSFDGGAPFEDAPLDRWVPPEAGPVIPFDWQTPVETAGGCVPYDQRPVDAFVPMSSASPAAQLAATSKAIVGPWIGAATSPWRDYQVTLQFTADGHWDGMGYDSSNPPPFYYGSSDATDAPCTALKTYALTSGSVASVGGTLAVPFYYGAQVGCGLPSWQGELSLVQIDAPGHRLQLSFSTSDGYGPITYDLYRVCP